MSSYATERSLLLTVEAQDLTEGVFGNVADELEKLADQAATVFDGVARSATQASDTIKAAAGEIPGYWQEQLQAVADFAALAFSEISSAAFESASAAASAASPIQAAWTSPFEAISATAKSTGGAITESLNTAAETAGTDAEKLNGSASDISAGLDKAASAANGFDAKLKTSLDGAATTAKADADKINGSVADVAKALDGAATASTSLDDKLKASMDSAAGTANSDSVKIVGSLDDVSVALKGISTAGDGMQASLSGSMDKAAVNVPADADKINLALKGVRDAAATTAAVVDESLGLAGAGTFVGKGGKAAKAAASESAGIGGLSLSDITSKLLTGGITAAIGIGGFSAADSMLHTVGSFSQQTGLGIGPTVQALMAAAGAHVSDTQLQTLSARLQLRLQQAQKSGTATLEGAPVSEGMGRLGINPAGLEAVLASKSTGPAAALQLLGISPETLTGMPANQQLALIATKLDEVKNANVRTATAMELFGGRGATSLLPLLNEFTLANTTAAGKLSSPEGKSLIADLTSELGGGGKGLVNYQEQLYMVELQTSAALIKLTPVIEYLTKEISLLIDALAHPGSAKSLETIAIDAAEIAGLSLAWKGGKKVLGTAGNAILKKGGSVIGDLAGGGGEALGGAGGDLAGFAAKALGPIGAGIGALAFPDNITNDTTAFAQMWQKLVAPHTGGKGGFGTKDSVTGIEQAATVFGLDPAAMLADSYAESGLNPSAHNKSGATGAFQFIPSTWATDTKKYLGQSIPFADAKNPYIASMIAAASMSQMGIPGMKGETALKNMIGDLPGVKAGGGTGFEHPGAAGAAGDLSRGLPFLKQLETELTKAEQAAATHGPKIAHHITKSMTDSETAVKHSSPLLPPPIDKALLDLVKLAETHGKQFSAETDKTMKEAEAYLKSAEPRLTTTGRDLMLGLLSGMKTEEPQLLGEARNLAAAIENTIRQALKTHSPSEVTTDIGHDIAAGLGIGMRRGMPDVLATATGGAGALTRSLQGAGAGLGGGGGQQIIIQVNASGNVTRNEEDLGRAVASKVSEVLWERMTHLGVSGNF